MAKDTFEYCRTCSICQLTKQSTQRPFGLLKSLPIPETPFTHLSMDFLFLLQVTNKTMQVSYDHVWVIVDRFSKYMIILPLPLNYTAEHLINISTILYIFSLACHRILLLIEIFSLPRWYRRDSAQSTTSLSLCRPLTILKQMGNSRLPISLS